MSSKTNKGVIREGEKRAQMMDTSTDVKNIEDLIKKVRKYNPGVDTEFLTRAYFFSHEAHGLQKRKEGTPYMEHPIAVASILAEMKMDAVTIAAALMHDNVEDTDVTVDDIRKRFGYETAFIVDGLTKLSRIEFQSKALEQAENLRKMLLSMSEDIRVILIKFADRLHNMRTLEFLDDKRRQRIAAETMEIYAPLANRLGIGWLKSEFEDLSFKYLMPKVYKEVRSKVRKRKEEHQLYVEKLGKVVEQRLEEVGVEGEVKGRVKHYYGIWNKMQQQGIPFDQVFDVLAIRVVTVDKAACYSILGLIHSLWKPVPGKFKDYIAMPKANMYQSLHTTVIGPGGERVEFQIRTRDMDMFAEEGIAAHWRYKDTGKGEDSRYISWLRELVQAQQDNDAMAFMEAVKGEVVPEVVYVFTPEGDIKELPEGSTPVDFAYAIHTEVGHRCVGARVNGKMIPLRHQLESGSTVEIITLESHRPSRDWLGFVVTTRAKNRIKQWLKVKEREQSVEIANRLVEEELRRRDLDPLALKTHRALDVARSYNMATVEDLLAAIGYGKISPQQAVNRLFPDQKGTDPSATAGAAEDIALPMKQDQKGVVIKGMDQVLYHTAKCCFPIPGDDLVGFVTRGKGVAVHRRDCLNLERNAVDEDRVIEVSWEPHKDTTSYARLAMDTLDKSGILADISAIMSTEKVNINSLRANSMQDGTARITAIVEVRDNAQLTRIIRKAAQTEGIHRIRRY